MRASRGAPLPAPEVPLPEPTRSGEPLWLEPYPDALLGDLPDAAPGPEARYAFRDRCTDVPAPPCQHCPMDHAEAQAFARQWVKDWNAHNVDGLLKHFTDDVVFTSPVAVRIFGGDGVICGKEALRNYWSEGVRLTPDLHFEVLALYVGTSTLVINYRNQAGRVASEVLTFEGSLVREGHGTHLAQAPVGLK